MSEIRPTIGDSSWFVHDRFGMFIHWGLYSLAARHEWVQNREEIPPERYEQYLRAFDPDLYDPQLWADAAANAGMKYFVITTKHHEGFCLWDSAFTEFKATRSPANRDLLSPMVDAFRSRGLRAGFYYSLLDWRHPHFTIDGMHPLRNHPDREKLNEQRNQALYAEYLHNQTRELLSQFGPVDVLWYDFSYPSKSNNEEWQRKGWRGKGRADWDSEKLIRLIRELQPQVLLDNRLDVADHWDFTTPEQWQPRGWVEHNGQRVVWEACQTFSGSWGYHRDESSWKSVEMLVQMLIDTVSKGGNLLLNVGPTGRGELDERVLSRLSGIGEWMKRHGRSIYGCTQAPDEFKCPHDCRLTWNADKKRLYLHVYAWPFKHLHLQGIGDRVEYAQLLNDASEIKIRRGVDEEVWSGVAGDRKPALLALEVPVQKPNVTVPVIELFLK